VRLGRGMQPAEIVERGERGQSGRCARCGTLAAVEQAEYSWWFHGRLCFPRWDASGHRGHPEADAENDRARTRDQPRPGECR